MLVSCPPFRVNLALTAKLKETPLLEYAFPEVNMRVRFSQK